MNAPLVILSADDQYTGEFNEWLDDHVEYVAGNELAKPIQDLLILRRQTTDAVTRKALDALYAACKQKFLDYL